LRAFLRKNNPIAHSMKLQVTNSLTGQKEPFIPLVEGHVGMYVCGPTVYNHVHLGNCRTFVNFDLIYRYLLHLGLKVRYVRNITDVGHLEGDSDATDAEDKLAKRARIEQLEPMEVAQKYTHGFHQMMTIFNTLPPSIEPRATGHIPEQIEMVEAILAQGYAYEANGSVYFDVATFAEKTGVYGQLSGRILEDLTTESRDLKNQSEKRHPADFAIWMKAAPEHLMRWNSPWSVGFPGWHLECSAMSTKYLGKTFDIHGGGFDLKFPHHENEVAQNMGACGCQPANYWLHANMLLLNGKKMSKSDGNTISPEGLFTGDSPHVTKGFSPMVVRFFFLQAHYRSTLDITDDALHAAEKGYRRLMEAYEVLQNLQHATPQNTVSSDLDSEITQLINAAFDDMSDDFNAPKALSRLFELASKINAFKGGQLNLSDVSETTLENLKKTYNTFIFSIFGLLNEAGSDRNNTALDGVMGLVLDLRKKARDNKDWGTSDQIRDSLKAAGILLKDGKDGTTWQVENQI
jgi:cysteinyl-tRNA synthetase